MKTILDERAFVFIAPDGTPQPASLGERYEDCIGIMELYATRGVSQPVAKLFEEGWHIVEVQATFTQIGTPDDAFNKGKDNLV
jgi:hypothetical protein